MTVGAGMELKDLFKIADSVKMSVQVGTLPAYAGLTLGGILATSAHGSGDLSSKSYLVSLLT